MLEKKICERCKKTYRWNFSGARGKNYCWTCCSHCSVCGIKLPAERTFGNYVKTQLKDGGWTGPDEWYKTHPDWGTGICFACEAKLKLELTKKSETTMLTKLGDKTFWKCEYCDCLNEIEKEKCFHCASPRKKSVSVP